MRKKIFTLLSLLVLSIATVAAQTAYLQLQKSISNVDVKKGVIYAIDLAAPKTITEYTVSTEEAWSQEYGAGTLAGDIYYSVAKASPYTVTSINFTTGNILELGSLQTGSLGFSDSNAKTIFYDESTKKLYVVLWTRVNSGEGDDATSSDKIVAYEVNTTDLSLKEAAVLWTSESGTDKPDYRGYGSDNNGGLIYVLTEKDPALSGVEAFWSKKVSVHRYDLTEKTDEVIKDYGTIKPGNAYETSSLTKYDENTYYLVCGTFIFKADISAEGEFTRTADGVLPGINVGICFSKSTADGEVVQTPTPGGGDEDEYGNANKVLCVKTIGDILGAAATDENGVGSKEVFYYNNENKLLRSARYGWQVGGTDDYGNVTEAGFEITNYYHYDYDENGNLVHEWSEQYGLYGTGADPLKDKIWKVSNVWAKYEYNDAGQLIKEIPGTETQYIAYEYDEEGNIIKMSKMAQDTYDYYVPNGDKTDWYLISSEEYSDFVAHNCPQTIVGDGFFESYKFDAKITYDDKNRKIKEERFNTDEEPTYSYYWTYEDDLLVKYETTKWKYNPGTEEWLEMNSSYTEYWCDVDDKSRVHRQDWSWDEWQSEPKWMKSGLETITEYSDFNGQYSCQIAVEPVENEVNTAKVWISAPSNAAMEQYGFDIYRYGMYQGRVLSSDAASLDPETGKYFYIDSNLKNGTYDYFVQTVLFDELEEMEKGKNISNVASFTSAIELPCVTNIRAVSKRYEKLSYTDPYEGITTEYNVPFVTIAWDAPEMSEDLDFERYNVYVGHNARVADNLDADGQATEWEFEFGTASETQEVKIEVVYAQGKVASEYVTFVLSDIPQAEVENETVYSIAGTFNEWNIEANQFTAQNETLHIINLPKLSGEIKIVKNTKGSEFTWDTAFGTNGEELVADVEYVPSLTGNNIMVSDNGGVEYEDVIISVEEQEDGSIVVLLKASNANGIEAITSDTEFTVYNFQGIQLLNKADKAAVNALPAGFYIINGKKVAIK